MSTKKPLSFIYQSSGATEVKQLLNNKNFTEDIVKRLLENDWTPQLFSRQLGHAFNSYTQAFNKKHNRTGSLFESPFERLKVDDRTYFCNLICYIHRNPQKHGFMDDFRTYPYSSYTAFLSNRKTKLNIKEPLKWYGGREDFVEIHKQKAELDKYRIEE